MRILHVCLDYPPRRTRYGSGTVNDDLLAELARRGHEVVVLTAGRRERGPAGIANPRVIETPVDLSELFLLPADRPTEMFASPAQLRQWNDEVVNWLAQDDRFDGWTPAIIHNDGWTTQPIADHLRTASGRPVATVAHVVDRHYVTVAGRTPRPADPEFRAGEERSFRNSDRIIVPSVTACDLATHYYPQQAQRIVVVPHGLDWSVIDEAADAAGRPQPRDDREVTVIYLGRISSERGWRPFLDAFLDAHALDSRLRLRVIGDGTRLAEATDRYRHDAVAFLGALPRAQVVGELTRADVFANSALIETFGIAELEAMGLGLAVISNAGFGKHTHVDHLESGIRIPIVARDGHMEMDQVAWSGWLTRLAADDRLRERLGRAARTRARGTNDVANMTDTLILVLDEILASPEAPR